MALSFDSILKLKCYQEKSPWSFLYLYLRSGLMQILTNAYSIDSKVLWIWQRQYELNVTQDKC